MIKRRTSGWSPWLLRQLPCWVLKIRIAVLKKREQTEDVKGEISECEHEVSFLDFQKKVRKLYVEMFQEPYPDGPVWPKK